MQELKLLAKLENLNQVLEFVETQLEGSGLSIKECMEVQIATEEIFVNISSYAYNKGEGEAIIQVEIMKNQEAKIIFNDFGIPYNPLEKSDPDITLTIDERSIGGLGIFMVKEIMDKVEYSYENGRNVLSITKKLMYHN